MSPASYLTAPPRVALASIAPPARLESAASSGERVSTETERSVALRRDRRVRGLRKADAERRRCGKADRHHEGAGDRIEDEMVARDDDRQENGERVHDPGE